MGKLPEVWLFVDEDNDWIPQTWPTESLPEVARICDISLDWIHERLIDPYHFPRVVSEVGRGPCLFVVAYPHVFEKFPNSTPNPTRCSFCIPKCRSQWHTRRCIGVLNSLASHREACITRSRCLSALWQQSSWRYWHQGARRCQIHQHAEQVVQ